MEISKNHLIRNFLLNGRLRVNINQSNHEFVILRFFTNRWSWNKRVLAQEIVFLSQLVPPSVDKIFLYYHYDPFDLFESAS